MSGIDTKAWAIKGDIDKLDSSELKISAPWNTLGKGWKGKAQTGRKYFQIMYPTRDFYWDYLKNSQNSNNKQTTQEKYEKDLNRLFTKDLLKASDHI